jgi:hypothetical protein
MIPTKQTVYLPVSENIIFHTENFKKQEGYFFTPEQLNEYTANVIKQALETAAEKALCDFDEGGCTEFVDEQSITNTFEETFKLYQV